MVEILKILKLSKILKVESNAPLLFNFLLEDRHNEKIDRGVFDLQGRKPMMAVGTDGNEVLEVVIMLPCQVHELAFYVVGFKPDLRSADLALIPISRQDATTFNVSKGFELPELIPH